MGAVRGKRRALRAKDFCRRLAEWLGFAVSPKSEGPCRILKYLGVIIDLERRELRADPRAVAALLETLRGVRDVRRFNFHPQSVDLARHVRE